MEMVIFTAVDDCIKDTHFGYCATVIFEKFVLSKPNFSRVLLQQFESQKLETEAISSF